MDYNFDVNIEAYPWCFVDEFKKWAHTNSVDTDAAANFIISTMPAIFETWTLFSAPREYTILAVWDVYFRKMEVSNVQ